MSRHLREITLVKRHDPFALGCNRHLQYKITYLRVQWRCGMGPLSREQGVGRPVQLLRPGHAHRRRSNHRRLSTCKQAAMTLRNDPSAGLLMNAIVQADAGHARRVSAAFLVDQPARIQCDG